MEREFVRRFAALVVSIWTALGCFGFSVDFFGCTPWSLRDAVVVGSRLLSADADGHIKCWSMTDHLANSWENTVGSMVEGDPVVALSWLHNGVKLALHVEKVCPSSAGDPVRTARVVSKGLGKPLPAFLSALGFLHGLGQVE